MLCRCKDHEWPNGRTNTYVAKIEPAGSSNESLICGNCDQLGAIFLNRDEFYEYEFEDKRDYTPWKADTLGIRLSDTPTEVEEAETRSKNDPPETDSEEDSSSESDPDIDSAADSDW